MSKEITVEGLKKEQVQLRKSFDVALEAFEKSKETYMKAKEAIVTFQNSYGRVIEVLEKPVPQKSSKE